MNGWLIRHNLLGVRRSPDFQRKLVVNVIFGFFMTVVALELAVLGVFLNDILTKTAPPGLDSLQIVNGALLVYFGVDFVARLFFQKFRASDARHYLTQPVTRSRIAHFILLKTMGTMVNVLPLFTLIPFFIAGVLLKHALLPSVSWLISLVCVLVLNTYLVTYVNLRFFKNAVYSLLAVAAVVSVLMLQRYGIITLIPLSRMLFNSLLVHPVLAVIPLGAAATAYVADFRFLVDHLYLEDLAAPKKPTSVREHFPLIAGFGELGPLIALDLKLMMRNRRARISLWMPFLMVFYGLMFYPNAQFQHHNTHTDLMLAFVGTFITGFFIMSYGIATFSYESRHFGLILTNRIDMYTYLKARYYFMLIVTLVVYLLSLFYVYFGLEALVVNGLMFLFNIGFTAFFFLFLATYNKLKFDLNAGYYSTQGKGSNQFIAVFLLLGVTAAVFFSVRWFTGTIGAFITLGAIGLTGLAFHHPLLRVLARQFYRRKYIMSEGFRVQ